jgi:hypothetical protein
MGLSRTEYIRRLAQDARAARITVVAGDWRRFADDDGDLGDSAVMDRALGMSDRPWLIDKSALVRVGDSAEWTSGTVASNVRESPLGAMPVEYLTPAIKDRPLEVQLLLADIGEHRAVDSGFAERGDRRTRWVDRVARR